MFATWHRPDPRRIFAWFPTVLLGLLIMGVWVALSLNYDTPGSALLRYVLYYAGCVTLPGTIVWKSVFGSRGWLADITWGSILGICLELLAWAVFSLAGLQHLLAAWPLLALIPLANRGARQRVLTLPAPPRMTLGLCLTAFAMLSLLLRSWWQELPVTDLPPTSRPYYVDIPWHLGLAHEATRAFPLLTPQLIDAGPLRYSWFVHAHIGAGSLITGLDVSMIMLRLWHAPMIVLGVAATALLARQLTGKAWAGGVAGLLVACQGAFPFWRSFIGNSNIFPLNSPTQTYSIPLSLLCVKLIVDCFRGALKWPGWLLLILVGVATAGSKSSIMLLLVAAVGGTTVVSFAIKQFHPRILAVTSVMVGLLVFALALVTGGGGGSSIQFLGSLTLFAPFRYLRGDPAFNEFFADDLVRLTGLGYWLLLALLVAMALRMLLALVVLVVPFVRSMRYDLAAWLLGGIVLAAWVPFLFLSHRGYSQYYFMYSALPFAAILGSWWLAESVPSSMVGRRVTFALGALAAVATVAASFFSNAPKVWDKVAITTFLGQTAVFFGLVAVLVIVAAATRRRLPGVWSGGWVLVLLAPLLVAPVTLIPWEGRPAASPPNPVAASITRAETEAGVWVNEHVGEFDVMATNAACSSSFVARCDARRWWLSGIGGRRVFLDGWRYVPEGADGDISEFDAQKLNDAAFMSPSDETIGALRDRGVSWMVVESLPGFPAPDLSRWGDVVFQNRVVIIYKLTR